LFLQMSEQARLDRRGLGVHEARFPLESFESFFGLVALSRRGIGTKGAT
jgi:hypothetical protein